MAPTAFVMVDIQNDYFPGGAFELEGAEAAAKNAARVLTGFREQGMPVVHVRHENRAEQAPFFVPGTPGAEIRQAVLPEAGEVVILKHHPNSFRETLLEAELRAQGVERLVVAGMMTLMCVDATVRAAKDLGFEVMVLHDACAARALECNGVSVPAAHVHAAFLAALGMHYAQIVGTDEVLAMLQDGSLCA